MNHQLDKLLERYWEAETSLQEEQLLKDLLRQSPGHQFEKDWFGLVDEFSKQSPSTLQAPNSKPFRQRRLQAFRWAASVLLVLGSYAAWNTYERHQEKQAYQEVRSALTLIQEHLALGQEQMKPINELQHLGKTQAYFIPK